MKNFSIKIIIALLAFLLGIVSVWAIGGFSYLAFLLGRNSSIAENSPQTNETLTESNFGKVEISLKRIYKYEDVNIAEFEMVNGTKEPISYMGYNKNSYCDITLKRGEKLNTVNQCFCGTGLGLQTLPAGETALYTVSDLVARYHLKVKKQKVTASFKFEVMIGAEKRKQELWTEEITFP
jgi:hypothetical protein